MLNSFKSNCVFTISISKTLFISKTPRRWKNGPNHWSRLQKKVTSTQKALQHFDDLYGQVYSSFWPSIRLALLSRNKYCAVVNNYSETSRIIPFLESLGALNLKDLLNVQKEKLIERKVSYSPVKKYNLSEANNVSPEISELISSNKFNEKSSIENNLAEKHPPKLESWAKESFENRCIKDGNSFTLQEFVPATKLKGMEGWIGESEHYSNYPTSFDSTFKISLEKQDEIEIPPELKLYTFEVGNISQFPKPKRGQAGVSDYYLMDGASVLPVLALGLEPGDRVLDACAAPGGKSFLCLQTLYPEMVCCNDISLSRLRRVENVMKDFFYDFDKKKSSGEIVLMQEDCRSINPSLRVNKILVDVPCTNDRHSVNEADNNIFRPDRIKERIKLPELQTQILSNALKLVEPGGVVVYSTCSLSPVQNDGVVQMALKSIWEETEHEISIVDMGEALKSAEIIFKFGRKIGVKYGHLIVPYLPSNYGPMYFCKFLKKK